MDNIEINKTWEDENAFEISLKVTTDAVKLYHKTYINNGNFVELSSKMNYFLETKKTVWKDMKNDDLVSFSLEFSSLDELGHIQIYIFVESEESNYKCQFPFKTTAGALYSFADKVCNFENDVIGMTIDLYQ